MERLCVICGSKDRIEEHHTKPRKLGGKKTILLCHKCHLDIENVKVAISIMKKERKVSIKRFRQIIDSFEDLGF